MRITFLWVPTPSSGSEAVFSDGAKRRPSRHPTCYAAGRSRHLDQALPIQLNLRHPDVEDAGGIEHLRDRPYGGEDLRPRPISRRMA